MKYFVLLVCLTIPFLKSYSQNIIITADSLSKYAYTMLGLTGTPSTKFGTCFFVRSNDDLFLVTAKHILYKCDSLSKKTIPVFKSIVVSVSLNPAIQINFTAPQRNDTCLAIGRDTDLVVIKIKSQWNSIINSVEKFMIPPFKELGDIEIFGQGLRIVSNSAYFENPHHIHLTRNEFTIYHDTPGSDLSYLDTVHYFIQTSKVGNATRGFSGSPVFLQDNISKNWRICGVLNGVISSLFQFWIGGFVAVKPEYIMKYIKEY